MILLRRARIDDIESLIELRLKLLQEVKKLSTGADTQLLRTSLYRYFSVHLGEETLVAWVAEVENQLVACSGFLPFERLPAPGNLSDREAYVTNMYTLPEWRGKGIAKSLLREIISFAQTTGIKRLWLNASPDGKPLYEKIGFAPITNGMELPLEKDTLQLT